MASPRWMLPLLILGTGAVALVPAARQFHDELPRSNNAVRKQRSLDAADSPEYYNDLHSFKYHGGDTDRKFDRDFDEDDEEIEFLPSDNGQLETVGEGLQGLNNKLLERALLDYLETVPEQEEPVASIFRERERSGSRKRGGAGSDRLNRDDKDLTKLFVEELQDGFPYGALVEVDDDDYLTDLQSLYDRYRAGRGNKVYETAGPMSWGELLSKGPLRSEMKDGSDEEFVDRDQDQGILYLPAERRNVNGRFPIGREFGSYRKLAKRYPIAKRSPRPTQTKLKATDPKVAQDLGALFGTQFTDSHNHTHKSDHEHEHDHNHDHDHERKHEPDQNHDHKHESNQSHEHEHDYKVKTEAPKMTPSPKGQKENVTKTGKSKLIQVRKKSVDWSQYFGIDRRKKKATFTAGQGTQKQDDEWMLQRYYENMAENLKQNDENEQKDKLEQMDTKLKYIKDLIIEEAMRYATSEDEADLQKVKDKLMSRMAAAYSLQKMRKALSELRNTVAAEKEAQRTQKEAQNNFTSNFRENSNPSTNSGIGSKTNEKRSSINNNIEESESDEEPRMPINCPELEAIEWRCRTVDNLAGDTSRMLYVPCVKLQICKACAQDEEGLLPCLANYALEAGKTCDAFHPRDGESRTTGAAREDERQSCANAALLLSQLQPPGVASAQCRARNSCLRRYHARYEHRYFRTSPAYEGTGGRRLHHEGALDALQQTMSER
ncbi:PREDICTED: stress response protein NST1 [Vollenhovia emeryi]|uniref:stress response protein NST1 n=1 Tax=Vollenhovia emeryi TaxID=411798 RepID=UPI0005F4679E|nr:PREDICTED: stress response protein NST1 [Vollenhovia emeryi]XP_011877809.1 PREDICTED: stress response protein NST1 [Vollenhovia emeryi]